MNQPSNKVNALVDDEMIYIENHNVKDLILESVKSRTDSVESINGGSRRV